mgnify:CR=1 FL=1
MAREDTQSHPGRCSKATACACVVGGRSSDWRSAWSNILPASCAKRRRLPSARVSAHPTRTRPPLRHQSIHHSVSVSQSVHKTNHMNHQQPASQCQRT